MTDQAADVLLGAARGLGLRCYMGPLPFDVDKWARKGLDSDLPRLEGGETEYHFEVRDPHYYIGTYFVLRLDADGQPVLSVGTDRERAGPYPADLDGWRAAVAEINRFDSGSGLPPRKYIWLHGHVEQAREVNDEYEARFNAIMARQLGFPETPEVRPARTPRRRSFLRSVTRRIRLRGRLR